MNEEMGGRREGEGKKKEGRREGEGREKGGRKEMNEEMGERYRRKKGGRRAGVSFPGHSEILSCSHGEKVWEWPWNKARKEERRERDVANEEKGRMKRGEYGG